MKAARLDQQITAYSPIDIVTAYGEHKQGWKREGDFWWADAQSYNGSAQRELSEVFSDYRIRFAVRWEHQPKETWQIEYLGGRYAIDAIEPDRKNGLRVLVCSKINQ